MRPCTLPTLLSVTLLLTLLGACAPQGGDEAPAEPEPIAIDTSTEAAAEITAANERFMRAFDAGDAAGVAAQYTADAWLLPPGEPRVEGREAIEAYWAAGMEGIASGLLESVEVRGFGDHATEIGEFTLTGADGSVLDHGSYVVLWQREDGVLKLHRDIWNSDGPLEAPTAAEDEELPAP